MSTAASISAEVEELRGTKPATLVDLFRDGPFVRLAMAMTVSSFGDWVGFLAVSGMVADGRSAGPAAYAVTGVMISRMLPSLFVGPFVGAVVDRFDRRKVMMAADIIRAALYACMPFLIGSLWAIFALSFVIESLSLVWSPARDASIPKLVPRRQLANANTISMISTYGTLPISGGVYAVLVSVGAGIGLKSNPSALPLWLDAGSFIFSAAMLTRVPISMPKRPKADAGPGASRSQLGQVGRDAADGIRFLREHPLARSMMVGILIAFGAVGAVGALGAVYAQSSLGAGAAGYGKLIASFGVGLAVGMATVSLVWRFLDKEHVFYVSMIAGGGMLASLGLAPSISLAVVIGIVLGLLVGCTWISGITLLQESVADEYRGRTFSALNVLSKLGLLFSLIIFPFVSATASNAFDKDSIFGLYLPGVGPRVALFTAGVAVVLGGLYSRVGLHRYRMQKPRALSLIPKLRKSPPQGLFVVFEGVEGSGKGTQQELAREKLESQGIPVLVTREPGGTDLGERVRQLLLDRDTGHLEPRAESLLFAAARTQSVSTVIRPALEGGKVVLCDRYIDSSVAYQGFARGVGETDVLSLNVWATQGLFPDLVVLLHLEPEEGLARAGGDPDRFESEGVDFHAKVSDAYLHIAEEHPERVVVIDASRSAEKVHEAVMAAIERVLPEYQEGRE